MAGNQTDAKNRASRELAAEESTLRNLRKNGANANQIRDQERRVSTAQNAYSVAEAAERRALSGTASSFF